MLGLETAFAVVNTTMVKTGEFSWRDVARVMSEAPARIGLVDHLHGRPIAEGEIANLVMVDAAAVWTVDRSDTESKSVNNPYHGEELTGRVEATILRGQVTYQRMESVK
jgi:dihydroorotase